MLGDNIVAFGHLHCVIFVHSIYYCVNSLVAVHGWHVVPSSGEYVYRCVCVYSVTAAVCCRCVVLPSGDWTLETAAVSAESSSAIC